MFYQNLRVNNRSAMIANKVFARDLRHLPRADSFMHLCFLIFVVSFNNISARFLHNIRKNYKLVEL